MKYLKDKPIANYIITTATTIQISTELLRKLQSIKMHEKESYENIILDLVEDQMELSKETKLAILEYEKDLKEERWDKFTKVDDVKKRLKVNV